ncbi:NAD-dependent epimerase/dehydratase family protein [Candidatus Pelagibacter sp.]|nr:NAD-dependent epimerase/dehydratase family protein [Candidatus Pelagibacter sp.]
MKRKIVLVTGCSGFIGSHLVELLLKKKNYVVGLDNLSTGRKKFIDNFNKKNFKFYKVDLLKANLNKYFKNVSEVYHLSANADVRYGTKFRNRDLEQNIIVTHRILEQSIKNKVKKFIFSSSGSVYGEADQIPTKENCPFPLQTSLYGASKLSAEALISAYAEAYSLKTYIFRFVSILGPRYSHGHVYDFIKKLNQNPKKLNVLGDGNQKKSYLHVSDCVAGIFKSVNSFKRKVNIINLGTNEYITVKKSIKIILNKLGLNPKLYYSGGKRGWVGDNPFIFLDTSKIRSTGWKPNFSIEKSVVDTVEYIIKNKWILKKN